LPEPDQLVAGTFSITTNPSQYGFSATAGQCVTSTYEYNETTYEEYELYSVGVCL
jgi:hypothetical protein